MTNPLNSGKTIVIHTPDGKSFAGRTALDVVCRMLESNVFTEAKTPDAYMRGVAARTFATDRALVRTDTAENFLTDLAWLGHIAPDDAH